MRLPTPPWPTLPDEQQASHPVPLRYEDLSQDGRLLISTLGPLYGAVVWNRLLARGPVAAFARSQGVLPILSRLVLDGGGGPFSPASPLQVHGGYDLGHSVDEHGEVARLHLRIWSRAEGPQGHAFDMYGSSGSTLEAGQVYAEHVFTRLFAPPAERKVLRLELPGVPALPPTRVEPLDPRAMLTLPAEAEPLDELSVDPVPLLFSLGHTDSNQHVNSLVYPRVFEDAALRRLRQHGAPTALLVRHADSVFRKPFFAGEAALATLRTFRLADGFGAVGTLSPESEGPGGRPSVYVRLWLRP